MKDAPARISMIMQVIRVVPITLAKNDSRVSEPDHHAIASEPRTPQAAHSVAVAQPRSRVRNTRVMRRRTGIRLVDCRIFSEKVIRGSRGGVRAGLRSDQIAM